MVRIKVTKASNGELRYYVGKKKRISKAKYEELKKKAHKRAPLRCKAVTEMGSQCKRNADTYSYFCTQHQQLGCNRPVQPFVLSDEEDEGHAPSPDIDKIIAQEIARHCSTS